MTVAKRLSIVLYQETPGLWVGRAIEHDLSAEGRTIGETVRAILRFVDAHSRFDVRHDRRPLSAFRPAPQAYWNAFDGGTPISLEQLGTESPLHWDVAVVIASRSALRANTSIIASA